MPLHTCYCAKFGQSGLNSMEICQKSLASRIPPFKSLKVIGKDTDHLGTYDFLLVNYLPISYYFQDKWQFQLKSAKIFIPYAFNAHAEGVPLVIL